MKIGRTPLLATAQSVLPRQAHTLARLARAMLTPSFYPQASAVKTFWWADERNFGDLITPLLLEERGVIPMLKPPSATDLIGVGSILELLPREFNGVVWGSGKMHADVETRLPHAQITAVRGALTRELIEAPNDTVLGDPGLLIGDHVRPVRRDAQSPIGFIVHFSHRSTPWFRSIAARSGDGAIDIDVRRGPLAVARDIARCRAIVSTSLHGIIVADSLGVPSVWGLPAPVLAGADFKFRDHESAVNPGGVDRRVAIDIDSTLASLVEAAWAPDTDHVAEVKHDLRAALSTALDAVESTRVNPLTLPLVQRRP